MLCLRNPARKDLGTPRCPSSPEFSPGSSQNAPTLIAAFHLFVQSLVPSLQLSHNRSFITTLYFIYSFWRLYQWPSSSFLGPRLKLDKTTLKMKLFQAFPPQGKLSAGFFLYLWVLFCVFCNKATIKNFSSTENMLQDASDALKGICCCKPCGSCSPQSPSESPVPVTCSPGKLEKHPQHKGTNSFQGYFWDMPQQSISAEKRTGVHGARGGTGISQLLFLSTRLRGSLWRCRKLWVSIARWRPLWCVLG